MTGTQNVVVVVVVVVVGTRMVDMLMEVVEMMMRTRSVDGMCMDLMYPYDIVSEINEEGYGKLLCVVGVVMVVMDM
jgi:hypothetical protein